MFKLTPVQRHEIWVFSQDLNDTKAIEVLNTAMPRRWDGNGTSPFIYDAGHLLQIGGGCDWYDLVFEDGQLKDENGPVGLAESAIEFAAQQWLENARCDLETLVGDEMFYVGHVTTPLEVATTICGVVGAMNINWHQAPTIEAIVGLISGHDTEDSRERADEVIMYLIGLSADV